MSQGYQARIITMKVLGTGGWTTDNLKVPNYCTAAEVNGRATTLKSGTSGRSCGDAKNPEILRSVVSGKTDL